MRVLRGVGRLALQLALVGLLLEGALRLLAPHWPGLAPLLYLPGVRTDFDAIPDLPALMGTSVQGYTPLQRRGDFVYNSRSMRTGEYAGTKRPGVHRIAVFGDSFANSSGGTPFRQMWPTRLEAELRARRGPAVEVFSLGVGGVGPGFELRLFELERDVLAADLVVVGFFVGNDFTDAAGATPWQRSPLREHSLVVRLLANLGRLGAEPWASAPTAEEAGKAGPAATGGTVADPDRVRDPERRRFSEEALVEIEARPLQLCLLANRRFFEARVDAVTAVLERFASEVEVSGAEFVVALVPDQLQVDDAFRGRVLARLGRREADLMPGCPQQPLASRLAERGIEVVDLLPAFRERAPEERLYWPGNTHWNVAGNALAARVLAAVLEDRVPDTREAAP